MTRVYADRTEAGIELGREIVRRNLGKPVVVLGLARGGLPVACEIARALGAPLDVMVVRKIGAPGQPELAIGAIAGGGVLVREPRSGYGVDDSLFRELVERERKELERRERAYRAGQPPLDLRGQTVVLVDDGLATGATMLAAIRSARRAGATRIVVAAPVAGPEAAAAVGREADEVVLLQVPPMLMSIGEWYVQFDQLEDESVQRLLRSSWLRSQSRARSRSGRT